MNNDVPRECVVRGGTTLRTRPFSNLVPSLGLALALAVAVPGGASETPPAGPRAEDTVPGSRSGSAAASALAAADPRGPARLVAVEPSPAGRWVALSAQASRPHRAALWFVDLESGSFRAFEGGEPTGAPLVWQGERLWTEVLAQQGSLARRQLVAIDPGTLAFETLDRDTELAPEWSHTVVTRRSGGRRVLTIEWAGTERALELPGGPETDYRVSETAGIVFYAEVEHDGALRVLRHDLGTGRAAEVVRVGGLEPSWTPSPDGLLVAASDDYRLRLLDAQDGGVVSGPWPAGEAEWLPGGHGHVLLTSGGHRYLLDVYADRRVHLEPVAPGTPAPRVHALAGGGFLVQAGERLDLLDADAGLVRRLVEG